MNQHGHVLDATRQRLLAYGITSVDLEQYLNATNGDRRNG